MALPNFCIAPYEMGDLSPEEPPCAPATRRVWVWNLFWSGYYLIREVMTVEGHMKVVARHQTRKNAPLLELSYGRDVCGGMVVSRLGREIYFDETGHLISTFGARCVPLSVSGHCWLAPEDMAALWSSPLPPAIEREFIYGKFRWEGIRDGGRLPTRSIATTPASQIEQQVRSMLADSDSDCAFAWKWVHLSKRERFELLCRTHEGTLQDCEQLLHAVLLIDPIVESSPDEEWEAIIGLEAADTSSPIKILRIEELSGLWIYISIDQGATSLLDSSTHLMELIIEGCGLHCNPEVKDRSCIKEEWEKSGPSDCRWHIKVSPPTQHERLEARLQLRDWLQGKVAPDEIDALLELKSKK